MPYEISKKGNKYFVQNKMTGKVMGHHNTKKEATAQMQTINMEEYPIRKDLSKATSIHMTGEDVMKGQKGSEHDEID